MITFSPVLIEMIKNLLSIIIPVIGIKTCTRFLLNTIRDCPFSSDKPVSFDEREVVKQPRKPKKVKVRKKTYDSPDCLANEPRGFFDKE